MRSRCCSGLGRPSGDAGMSGRRVTSKAPSLAHVVGGSGRSEASPTAILKDTHSLEGEFLELRLNGVLESLLPHVRHCFGMHLGTRRTAQDA
jgi:hypothetical protein